MPVSEEIAYKNAADWIKSSKMPINCVAASHVWFFYCQDVNSWMLPKRFGRKPLEESEYGVIVAVMEIIYALD